MRSMKWIFTLCLIAGCARNEPPEVVTVPQDGALFCDIEEPRGFTQAEIDWRAANAPWNLRRDYKTNLAWERECGV